MAYISQTEKKELAPAIKKVLKAYGMKGTLSINHYSTLAVNLKKGSLDLIGAAQKKMIFILSVMVEKFQILVLIIKLMPIQSKPLMTKLILK